MNFKEEVLAYLGKNSFYEEDSSCGSCGTKKPEQKPAGNKNFLAGDLTPEEIEMINLFRKKKGKKPLSSCLTKDDHTNGRNGSVKTDEKTCEKCGKNPCQCSVDAESSEDEEASVNTESYSYFGY